jgi:preprotein translocase subunit SecA
MAGRGTDIVLGGNVEKQIQFIEANPDLSDADKAASARRCAMNGRRCTSKWWPLAACTSSAPSATNRAASTTSCVAVPPPGRPGMSRFYLSLDDPLLRIFAGDRVRAIMDRLKMPEGEPIEAGIVTRSIESAQRKVEARNFDIRKQLLEYDDVANDQRKVIYQQRNELLEATDISELIPRCATAPSPTWCANTCRQNRWKSSGTSRAWKRRWPRVADRRAAARHAGKEPT